MSEATYLAVKKTRNYKVTAVETVFKTHEGTNMLIEDEENIILDEEKFKGATKELALFAAMKQVEKEAECDMANVRWDCRPFPRQEKQDEE